MTGIQWTDATWNPVVGCTRVSAGCDRCYSVPITHRLGAMAEADRADGRDPGRKAAYEGLTVLNRKGERHFNGVVRCVEEALPIPLKWRKPRRVFVNSMSDLFHDKVPFGFIDKVFAVMAVCPQHTFQILTKRPERMAAYTSSDGTIQEANAFWVEPLTNRGRLIQRFVRSIGAPRPSDGVRYPLPNVWLGTSVEDQAAADERIPHLLRCHAAVRFLSCEPLLGSIDLEPWLCGNYCDVEQAWVIVGGESGHGARGCDVNWIRSIIDQCRIARVPCFLKQLGRYATDSTEEVVAGIICRRGPLFLRDAKGGDLDEWPEDLRIRQWPTPERVPEERRT